MNLIEQILEKQGDDIVTSIRSALDKKTLAAVQEASKQVMSEMYRTLEEGEGEGFDHTYKNAYGDNTSAYGYREHPLHKYFKAAGMHLAHSYHEDGNHSHTYVKGHTNENLKGPTEPQPHQYHEITTHHHDTNAFRPNWRHRETPKGHVFGRDPFPETSGKGYASLKKHLTSGAVDLKEEAQKEPKKVYCGKKGCRNKNIEHVHPDDKLYPHGLTMGPAERIYGLPDEYKTTNEEITRQPFDVNRVQGIDYNNDSEHANNPFHSTLEKHGFQYDYTGKEGEHHYKHSNPKNPVFSVMVSKNPYQHDKLMYSATARRSGTVKTGDQPEKLEAHLNKMSHKLKESELKEAFGGTFKGGQFKAYGGRPMDQRKAAKKEIKHLAFGTKTWDGQLLSAEQKAEHIKQARELAQQHGIPWNEIVESELKEGLFSHYPKDHTLTDFYKVHDHPPKDVDTKVWQHVVSSGGHSDYVIARDHYNHHVLRYGLTIPKNEVA